MLLHRFNTDPSRVKVNAEYPIMLAPAVVQYYVGFIPALEREAFASNFP